ncbi:aminotransferase class IV [Parvularcula lutaonensis]|uniref:Probable branched-chain-amino-acid aminotransferase n=1 Tax=Parvularcula lutaonensis TaxID=491923 RepID=A0ABV7MGI1_9PROT|nr:aminotransferase class IV [Parvularcula lutaonensis]GGY55475.1 4-amino-4-deoxychorismate lyase [Parvularcula lutaonensis]
MIALLDGQRIDGDAPALPVTDRGFLLGDGLFSTLRVEGGRALLLSRHLDRLDQSGAILELPVDRHAIEADIAAAIEAHGDAPGSMRITLSRGTGPRGLLPPPGPSVRRVITIAPAGPRRCEPVSAIVSTHRRNDFSPLSRMKSLSYQDQVLARMEAAGKGASDAVMLNTRSEPASTSMANLLARTKNGWVTPPVCAGILPGIVRAVLLEAREVTEAAISQADLASLPLARTNSLVGVEPLALQGGALPDIEGVRRLTQALEAAEKAAS